MPHKHKVYDTNLHFFIDPVSRTISNQVASKSTLIQGDHNSERCTFEIPRLIDGHDMTLCDRIQVHYLNVSAADKNVTSSDVYLVEDIKVKPDAEDTALFSWLVSGNATKYAGMLSFCIRFICLNDEGKVSYAWHTGIYNNTVVGEGFNFSESTRAEYSDVLEAWKAEVLASMPNIDEDLARKADKEYVDNADAALEKRIETLESATLKFIVDESTGYEKLILPTAAKSALLKSIGGATAINTPDSNLFNPASIWSADFETVATADGGMKAFIPASYLNDRWGNTAFYCGSIEPGSYRYKVETQVPAEVKLNGDVTCYLQDIAGELELGLVIPESVSGGYVDVELTIHVMLVRDGDADDTATLTADNGLEFVPYGQTGTRMQHAKVERIESIGAQLIPFPYKSFNQIAGVPVIVNADGGITLKGTATKTEAQYISAPIIINTPTSLSIGSDIIIRRGGIPSVRAYKTDINGSDSSFLNTVGSPGQTAYAGTDIISVRVVIYLTKDVEYDCTIYPMLNYGAEPAPYVPYQSEPIDSITIPEAVRALDGYGREGSYIEWVDDTVTLTVTKDENLEELAVPTVTDVTHLFTEDNEIEVQAGGSLRFVNSAGLAVPSSVGYVIRKG